MIQVSSFEAHTMPISRSKRAQKTRSHPDTKYSKWNDVLWHTTNWVWEEVNLSCEVDRMVSESSSLFKNSRSKQYWRIFSVMIPCVHFRPFSIQYTQFLRKKAATDRTRANTIVVLAHRWHYGSNQTASTLSHPNTINTYPQIKFATEDRYFFRYHLSKVKSEKQSNITVIKIFHFHSFLSF